MADELDLTDDWKMLHGESTVPAPKILSPGEMLDRIYRSIHALWLIDPPYAGDTTPTITVKIAPSSSGEWRGQIEAARMSSSWETGKSYEDVVTTLHTSITNQHEQSVKSRQQEIDKRLREMAVIQKAIDETTQKMERYRSVLTLHTT